MRVAPAVTTVSWVRQRAPLHASSEREPGLVRERGYASTTEEHEIGLAAIGAPIRTMDGHVIAAEISQRHGFPRRG